jgi:protein SCO1
MNYSAYPENPSFQPDYYFYLLSCFSLLRHNTAMFSGSNQRRSLNLLIIVTAAAIFIALRLSPPPAALDIPEELQSIVLPESRGLPAFKLTGHDGREVTADTFRGQWTIVFFGYTHCPDICPTALANLRQLLIGLEGSPFVADTGAVFISVDPARDTPAHLAEFVHFFHPHLAAATGNKEDIDTLARRLNVVYVTEGDTQSDNYIIHHTASLYLIDPASRWVATYLPPHTPDKLLADYIATRHFFANPDSEAAASDTPMEP